MATPHAKTPTFNGRTTKPLSSTINERYAYLKRYILDFRLTGYFSDHHDTDRVVAPQILLGRVHKQMQENQAFMQADAPTFCVGVANEITLLPTKEHQLEAITIYLERVAAYIDGARPHAVTMFNQFGPTSEWKEARHVQNNMSLAMEYLDEIHHRVETGDLAAAIDLNLLSFQ